MNEVTPVETCAVAAVDPSSARAPVGMLCELTHRCPLQCPYCSNPTELDRVATELTTAEWQDVMRQAGELGILQVHLPCSPRLRHRPARPTSRCPVAAR